MDFYDKYDPGFVREPKKANPVVRTILFIFLSALAVVVPLFLNYDALINDGLETVNLVFTVCALLAWGILLALGRKYPVYTAAAALYWAYVTYCGIAVLVMYRAGGHDGGLAPFFIAVTGYLCGFYYAVKDLELLLGLVTAIGAAATVVCVILLVRELSRRRRAGK